MSFTLGYATGHLFDSQIGGTSMNPVEKLVMAAGAGFHEELIFRVILFGGRAYLIAKVMPFGKWPGLVIAGVGSSIVFSAIHYFGPFGDPVQLPSFVFRVLAGLYLALVYRLRGFAVAVYTHTIYDLVVFFL